MSTNFTPPYIGTLECEMTLDEIEARNNSLRRLGEYSLQTVYAQMQAQRCQCKFDRTIDLIQSLAPPIIGAFGQFRRQ